MSLQHNNPLSFREWKRRQLSPSLGWPAYLVFAFFALLVTPALIQDNGVDATYTVVDFLAFWFVVYAVICLATTFVLFVSGIVTNASRKRYSEYLYQFEIRNNIVATSRSFSDLGPAPLADPSALSPRIVEPCPAPSYERSYLSRLLERTSIAIVSSITTFLVCAMFGIDTDMKIVFSLVSIPVGIYWQERA